MIFAPDGSLLVSSGTNEVLRYDGTTGAFLGAFVAAGNGGLSNPRSLAFGPDGNLYVSSSGSNSMLRFSGSTGAFLGTFVAANFIAAAGSPDASTRAAQLLRLHTNLGAFSVSAIGEISAGVVQVAGSAANGDRVTMKIEIDAAGGAPKLKSLSIAVLGG